MIFLFGGSPYARVDCRQLAAFCHVSDLCKHVMICVTGILLQQSVPGGAIVAFVLVAREIPVQVRCWGDEFRFWGFLHVFMP
jgi:hypothetical protein